ncbi:MAG TPA: hypothetical protein VMX36_13165 [Sedimentisphaerales bacterium]|nr:hypothetical protein [Sedimentisphaerales bacterium]
MSWATVAIGGGSAAASYFGSKTKGEGFEGIPSTPKQDRARSFMQDLFLNPIENPTQQIAGMSANEQMGQDLLSRFLAEGPSEERGAALSFLTGLLDKPDDIMQLPEIKALMAGITDQTSDLVNTSMRRTQLQGMGTSGPQGSAVGRELAKGQTSMVAALAPYMAQMRGNQLTASQLINSLVSGEEGSAVGKIGAAGTYGALPRQLEQAEKDAEYQKMLNDILAKYNLQMPAAQNILNETRYMYDPGMVQPSAFSQIGSALPGLAMMYNSLSTPGGGGTTAIGDPGSPVNFNNLTPYQQQLFKSTAA